MSMDSMKIIKFADVNPGFHKGPLKLSYMRNFMGWMYTPARAGIGIRCCTCAAVFGKKFGRWVGLI